MQTFLPFSSFGLSAASLDRRRLGTEVTSRREFLVAAGAAAAASAVAAVPWPSPTPAAPLTPTVGFTGMNRAGVLYRGWVNGRAVFEYVGDGRDERVIQLPLDRADDGTWYCFSVSVEEVGGPERVWKNDVEDVFSIEDGFEVARLENWCGE